MKQDSIYFWVDINDDDKPEAILFNNDELLSSEGANCYSAFTVAELGDALPHGTHSFKFAENDYCVWNETISFSETAEADARAKMLIYLLSKKVK